MHTVPMPCLHSRPSVYLPFLSSVRSCSNFYLALYNIDMGWGFQILFTLSSQLIGIALAGLFRSFLIWYVGELYAGILLIVRIGLPRCFGPPNFLTYLYSLRCTTRVGLHRARPMDGGSRASVGSCLFWVDHMCGIGKL